MNTRAPVLSPRTAALMGAGLFALSMVGLWRDATVTVTPDVDASRAVAHVIAHHVEGDLVMVTPSWEDGLWLDLSEATPALSLLKTDRLDPLEGIGHTRLWVIALHGRNALNPPAIDLVNIPDETHHFGLAQVARFSLNDLGHVAHLSGALADLEVSRRFRDERPSTCPWRVSRHACGRDAWLDVRVETRDVFHRPASWVYAHPGRPGETLEIRWPSPPSGAKFLVLRAGMTQAGVRHDVGSDVTVDLFVDDTEKTSLRISPHVYGLYRAVVPLDGAYEQMRVEVRAEEPAWRELMLEVDLMEQTPKALHAWVDQSPL